MPHVPPPQLCVVNVGSVVVTVYNEDGTETPTTLKKHASIVVDTSDTHQLKPLDEFVSVRGAAARGRSFLECLCSAVDCECGRAVSLPHSTSPPLSLQVTYTFLTA